MEITEMMSPEFVQALVKLNAAYSTALCRVIRRTGDDTNTGVIWRTKKLPGEHPLQPGIFVMGIGLNKPESKTLYFYMPLALWDNCWFARELEVCHFPIDPSTAMKVDEMIKLIDDL